MIHTTARHYLLSFYFLSSELMMNEKMCKVDYRNQEPAIKELTDIPVTDDLYS
jgi:hypothetical protein